MKKIFLILTIIAVIFIITISILSRKEEKNSHYTDNQVILFYSKVCPHCENVNNFIKANHVKSKIKFQELEVTQNQKNLMELVDRAKVCGLSTTSLAVPFLWTGNTCITGDQGVINYFKHEMDVKYHAKIGENA